MARNRNLIIVVVVALFVVVGGLIIFRGTGGGGRPVSIDMTVKGDSMDPSAPSAKQGDRVTMTITADAKEEIHLHGYDVKFEIESAGGKVTKTFTADKTGQFEIEIERKGKHIGDFTVSP